MRRFYIFILLCTFISSCAFGEGEIVITKLPQPEVKATVAPRFDASAYHSILVILPDAYGIAAKTVAGETESSGKAAKKPEDKKDSETPHPTVTLLRSQDYDYVINEAEHTLLQMGFNVISRDVVARIDEVESHRYGDKSYLVTATPTEKAILLGQKTNADAILVISHLGAWPVEMNFAFDDDAWSFKAKPKPEDAEGIWVDYSLWEVTVEAKLIDIKTGEVAWMGRGKNHSRNLFESDWIGVLHVRGDDTKMIRENFRIEDFNTYSSIYRQVAVLVRNVLQTLKPGQSAAP
jgi:hypothetical protein